MCLYMYTHAAPPNAKTTSVTDENKPPPIKPVCPNEINPYHQCSQYCADKFGIDVSTSYTNILALYSH